ncbi:MAG: hypothetical protein Q7S52_00215, partial [bacterium]|nr:hypothetical protein [bacterium]
MGLRPLVPRPYFVELTTSSEEESKCPHLLFDRAMMWTRILILTTSSEEESKCPHLLFDRAMM